MATKGTIAAGKEKAIARLREAMSELSQLVGVEPITIEKKYRDVDYNQMDQMTRLAEWAEELALAVRGALDTVESANVEQAALRQAVEVSNTTIAELQAEVEALKKQIEAEPDQPETETEEPPADEKQSDLLPAELDEESPVPPLPEIADEQEIREWNPPDPPTKSKRKN